MGWQYNYMISSTTSSWLHSMARLTHSSLRSYMAGGWQYNAIGLLGNAATLFPHTHSHLETSSGTAPGSGAAPLLPLLPSGVSPSLRSTRVAHHDDMRLLNRVSPSRRD